MYMNRIIKHISVIGSGVMGSRIACHFANAGIPVLLLDICPKELTEKQKAKGLSLSDKAVKNSLVSDALTQCLKEKPASLYHSSFRNRISVGNLEDDFEKINQSDWIIEVVVENLKIKQSVFEKVEMFRKKDSLVSSNTSGIPIQNMSEGRSQNFLENFTITHFFNPPRYLPLLEIVPNEKTKPAVTDFLLKFGKTRLGKTTILAKDTPAFIANRIGVFNILYTLKLTKELDLSVSEVDKLTGSVIGKPKSATYRTADVVGLDTLAKVAENLHISLTTDEQKDLFQVPAVLTQLIKDNRLGQKFGKGFYFKTKTEKGKKEILELDLSNLQYRKAEKPKFATLSALKNIEKLEDRYAFIVTQKDKAGEFYKKLHGALFAYVSHRIPEIANYLSELDEGVKAGFGWKHGPFEIWQAIGIKKGIQLAEEIGEKPAQWVYDLAQSNKPFYETKNNQGYHYDSQQKTHIPIPIGTDLKLDYLREKHTIWSNKDASIIDLGDGILNIEFHSKMNSLGGGVLSALNQGIELAEKEHRGVVISNEGTNFSVGANLGMIFMLAAEQEFDELNMIVNYFQKTMMRMRYSSVPVIAAPHGMTLGGGCELCLHADKVIAHAETYMGLVEFGVGVIPGGGGTKEMALRLSNRYLKGDAEINALEKAFMTIGQAKVSTSGMEAFDLGFLIKGRDQIVMNKQEQLSLAKQEALLLSNYGYSPPQPEPVRVLGKNAMGPLYVGIDSMKQGGFITEYDTVVAQKLAEVMAGGTLSEPTLVSEEYLLKKEREAFVSLCMQRKTLERIQHMLTKGKALRN